MSHFRVRIVFLVVLTTAVFLLIHQVTAQTPLPDDPFDRMLLPYLESAGNLVDDASEPAVPEVRLPWSRVVYQTLTPGNWEIYAGKDDGTNTVRLTNNGIPDIHPRLNRGGTHIVYASRTENDYEIVVMNSSGGGRVVLTDNTTDDVFPAWSPDGSKIAFQAYRDGQAEIYVMNANGYDVTRLTNNPAYDGYPVWSPNGSKIAFLSNRSGNYYIYVMNANGSGQTRIGPPRSLYPAWSPDGSQIAFSCDLFDRGWLDICVMDADGTNLRWVYGLSGERDAWVSGWSPDGRFITYTAITFVNYSGVWYWTVAYGRALTNTESGVLVISLSSDNHLWNPDWQTLDVIRPNSSVLTLPDSSPYRFTLNWSGSDSGGAGLKNYDVQVMVGNSGVWTDWLTNTTATSGEYEGTAGQKYSFRSRARDNAYNLETWPSSPDAATTVETLPPQTAVSPLPTHTRIDDSFYVSWGGIDPGGSGIKVYDIEYRQDVGTWRHWLAETTDINGLFDPGWVDVGSTIYFRSRARDNAGNQELWPIGDGDTSTILYATAIRGVVQDNSGTPIQGVTLTTNPASFQVVNGDENGRYASYLDMLPPTYTAHWAKNGYGPLPITTFFSGADVSLPIVLPPADNVISNSGFETGVFAPGWQPGGSVPPLISSNVPQTGNFAAHLGQVEEPFLSELLLGSGYSNAQILIDNNQVPHAAWFYQGQLLYTRRIGNAWLPPQVIVNNMYGGALQMAVDNNNTIHIVYSYNGIHYTQMPDGGNWSAPQTIVPSDGYPGWPAMHLTDAGIVHLVWPQFQPSSSEHHIFYKRRESSGLWTTPVNLSASVSALNESPRIMVDAQNAVHVIWLGGREASAGEWYSDIFYAQQTAGGNWSTPLNISRQGNSYLSSAELSIATDGMVHVGWFWQKHSAGFENKSVYHASRSLSGIWSTPYAVYEGVIWSVWEFNVSLDREDNLHFIIWQTADKAYHRTHSKVGGWSPAVALEPVQRANLSISEAVVDSFGLVHAVYQNADGEPVHYSQQISDGRWTRPCTVTPYAYGLYWQMKVDDYGQAHILWANTYANYVSNPVKYAGPTWSTTAGFSTLSQTMTVPISMTTPTFSFLHQGSALLGPTEANLELTLDDGLTTTHLWNPGESNVLWRHQAFDLSPWLGQTITLTFHLTQTANAPLAQVYLDEVTLGAAHPDAWVAVSGGAGLPDEQVTHIITYGNRGGTIAANTQLTYTLPADLTFISASLPPISTAPLVWELGDLAAGSGPVHFSVVVQVSPMAVNHSTLNSTATIHLFNDELELLNNSAQGQTYVGRRVYLPLLMR